MKYKVGDKVRVRRGLKASEFYGGVLVNSGMAKKEIVTIASVDDRYYKIEEDGFRWTDRMFEGLVEKKPIETEYMWYVQIVETDTHILKQEEPLTGVPEDGRIAGVLKKYFSEHDGKYYAICERRCVVKE